jgi:pullulanase
MVVNYMSAHDNNTLWDKLILSNGDNTVEERLAMNRLGATLMMISKGTVFFQAGEEILRTKDGDENSYKSSDAINNINWSVLKEGANEYEMMLYYQELIRVRKTYDIFRTLNTAVSANTSLGDGKVAITLDDHVGGKALIVSNPTGEAMTYTLSGSWNMIVNGTSVMAAPETCEGTITIPAYTAVILVNDNCLNG